MILNSLKFSIKMIHNLMAKYVREREGKKLQRAFKNYCYLRRFDFELLIIILKPLKFVVKKCLVTILNSKVEKKIATGFSSSTDSFLDYNIILKP